MSEIKKADPIRTFEHLIKILKANKIIIGELDFNQLNIFSDAINKWADYKYKSQPLLTKEVEEAAEKSISDEEIEKEALRYSVGWGTGIDELSFKAGAKWYASQLNNKPVEDEENKEDQVEKIAAEIDHKSREHLTIEGLRFVGISLAEVHEILSNYGYKYKAPF